MYADHHGCRCVESCPVTWPEPGRVSGLPARLHDRVAIEGVGVAYVTTEPHGCPGELWETNVRLSRFQDGRLGDPIRLTGSVTPAIAARDMHTYWCDLETLTLCVQGVPSALGIIDDYFDRKQKELHLGDWADKND